MTQITVVTQNEVSIIGENPFFMNDIQENDAHKKEIEVKDLQKSVFQSKNRSVNLVSSSGI